MSLNFLARILLSLMFGVSVYKNLTGGFSDSVKYVASKNLPNPNVLVALGMMIKGLGVYSILTGKYNNIALPLLIIFMITVLVLFNNPMKNPDKLWKAMSLIGVIGGLILVYKGSPKDCINPFSLSSFIIFKA